MPRFVDLTGRRFHRLVVIQRDGHLQHSTAWLCRCDCGVTKRVNGQGLTAGTTKSCGCFRRDWRVAENLRTKPTHRLTKSATYESWKAMLARVAGRTTLTRKYYLDRGIVVCDRWRKFENFLCDMGLQPDGLTLDRIHNDGNYEPGNCRLATRKQQQNNRRTSIAVTHDGITDSLVGWADRIGVPYRQLHGRYVSGLPLSDVLFPGRLSRWRKHHAKD